MRKPRPKTIAHRNQQVAGKGRYAGPVLHNRFQVIESFLKNQYILADLEAGGDPILEETKTDGSIPPVLRFESIEAAEAAALKLVDKAPGKARLSRSLTAGATKAPRGSRGPSKPTAAAKTRELLQSNPKWTDAQIHAEVVKDFPTFRLPTVAWYRRELQQKT